MLRLLFSATLLFSGVAACAAPPKLLTDTVVLATSQKWQTFDKGQEMRQIKLEAGKHKNLTANGQYFLILDSVVVHTLPEGVYELYLLPANNRVPDSFSPDDGSFVDLLNLYNLSDKSKPPTVSVNVSRNAEHLISRNKPCQDLLLIVFFRGNEMPDQKPVAHTGNISFGKIRLVQVSGE